MNEHRHFETRVDPRPPYICACGATWDEKNNRWREPKTQKPEEES